MNVAKSCVLTRYNILARNINSFMKLFVSLILENKEKIKSYFVREHSLLIRQSSNESRCISKINNISFVGVVYKRAYTKATKDMNR